MKVMIFKKIISFTLYPAHRSMQREPNVKKLRTSFSAESFRHCVSDGTQRRALPRAQSEDIKIFNVIYSIRDQIHNQRL